MFYNKPRGIRGITRFSTRVCVRRGKRTGRLNKAGGGRKNVGLFVIDTGCEINRVNFQC